MTRDPLWPPPSASARDTLASTELRDLALRPTSVLPAHVTIIHPQLRDLLVPFGRGDVLYPRGRAVERLRWDPPGKDARAAEGAVEHRTETFASLTFTPTCLTVGGDLFVCGAQHGELYVQDLASAAFKLHTTIPTRAINNSISILPPWPGAWARRAHEKRLGHARRGDRAWDEDEGAGADGVARRGRVRRHEWEDTSGAGHARAGCASDDDDDEGVGVSDSDDGGGVSESGNDDDDDDDDDTAWAATYPNTLPFGHAPRMATSPPARPLAPLPRPHRRAPPSAGPSTPAYVASTGRRRRRRASSAGAPDDEPRMVISSNDHSVKMVSIHAAAAAPAARPLPPPAPPQPLPPPLPYYGTPFGFDGIGMNEGIRANSADLLAAQNDAMRIRLAQAEGRTASLDTAVKLVKVGGAKFKTAVNHSSLSPDLRYMVTVGDSTDVFLHEVVKGGKEFRNVGVYTGASDSGFSTAWSKDGRKFAVASQDGQVTVWDHRSSRPLAVFYTSPAPSLPSSFIADLAASRHASLAAEHNWLYHRQTLVDSMTGQRLLAGGSSGREPARVVKFSPEGSSRDLLVFTEENTHIHMVDARTFDAHVVVPVPTDAPAPAPAPAAAPALPAHAAYAPFAAHVPPPPRHAADKGMSGIAGVAFDPTGDWLYAATERTVVEWDVGRCGGGEAGTWAMA